MFIVIYRPHNEFIIDTQYIGPFASYDEAYEYLCTLPALGVYEPNEEFNDATGVKFVQDLTPAQ